MVAAREVDNDVLGRVGRGSWYVRLCPFCWGQLRSAWPIVRLHMRKTMRPWLIVGEECVTSGKKVGSETRCAWAVCKWRGRVMRSAGTQPQGKEPKKKIDQDQNIEDAGVKYAATGRQRTRREGDEKATQKRGRPNCASEVKRAPGAEGRVSTVSQSCGRVLGRLRTSPVVRYGRARGWARWRCSRRAEADGEAMRPMQKSIIQSTKDGAIKSSQRLP